MVIELAIRFDHPAELDAWMAIFRKYNLEEKIFFKKKNGKKLKTETPTEPEQPTQRVWKSLGIGNLNGALDNIPNIREYAYED
jgi:hypothetical protein